MKIELFPVVKTLRTYSWQKASADLRAAVNVALLDFPQAMAYALIAGLPVQIGIFCSSLASVVGPFFASSRFVMLGPTNSTAVMLLSTFLTLGLTQEQSVVALPLLLILVGIFMTCGALLRAAVITQYISRTVVVGYITAAACLIIINQLKIVFGLEVPRSATCAEAAFNFISGLPTTDFSSFVVGGVTLLSYYLISRFGRGVPTVALTLILVSILTTALRPLGLSVDCLEAINAGDWPLTLPVIGWDTFRDLAPAALAIAFLSLLESSSIAKTLAAQSGDQIDLNQQMFSMGMANFASALGSGMTVSGSLTRSVLNFRSGAQTCLSSVYSGLILIAALFFCGKWIQYIPKPALAALVITVGLSLLNREAIRVALRTTKSDATVFVLTFGGGLILPLDTAIYLGATGSLLLFVHKASRPILQEISFSDTGNLIESRTNSHRPEIAIVHVEGDLFFASCDLFLDQMRRLVEHPQQRAIILRMRNAHHLDATAAATIKDLIAFSRSRGCIFLVSGAHAEIERIFRQSGLMDFLGEHNFFRTHQDNPNISTRDALRRAQELTGLTSADITIFAAPKQPSSEGNL